jgi:regulatory protein YycI of two-component signal transduction system YycFG
MENNQPPPTTPVPPTEQTPIVAAPAATPPHPTSRFKMLFLILFLLGVVFLGGTYLFVTMQKKTSSPTPIINKTVETQKNVHKLDEELQSVDTKSVEGDFTEVDQELKNL